MFTQKFRDDIATFALSIGDDNIARWTVELCGEIAEFTYEEWSEYGMTWAVHVLENTAAA